MSVVKHENGKWVVYSETTHRRLGTYNTKEEAVKRLRQVEYFKAHPKAKSEDLTMINRQNIMLEIAKKRKLDPKAGVRNRGDVVFPAGSSKVKDHKDHFPINNANQARNALSRVAQYSSAPPWYSGSLESLKRAVQSAVKRKYPKVNVTKGGAELIKNEPHAAVKNPNKEAAKVPSIKTPTLDNLNEDVGKVYAEITKLSEVGRKILASNLMDQLSDKKDCIDNAIELAKKLESDGLSEEEFASLADYTQYDILMQMLNNTKASANRRNQTLSILVKRMNHA
jgi:hypothetical protein